ncbi:MAG: hypothetical protein K9G46_08765 [Flavobacteriales bacterium]|nr:hypothetical protein [Flavobacteriales bacterium]
MKYILVMCALFCYASAEAQIHPFQTDKKERNYYTKYDGSDFVVLKDRPDTIFSKIVKMQMASNDPIKLEFQIDGRDTVIKGTGCLNAIAFQSEEAIMELMPKNPEKPQKGSQHMFRSTEGYITIWSNQHKFSKNYVKPQPTGMRQEVIHNVEYMIVSVNNGPLFIPSMKNYKNQLYPLYRDCAGMDKSGFSDFFAGVIRLSESYNETCGQGK